VSHSADVDRARGRGAARTLASLPRQRLKRSHLSSRLLLFPRFCCEHAQRTVEDVAQVEEPGERGGAPGARGGVALASAQPGLHGSAQMENRTKASVAKLRMTVAIPTASMMESRLDAMRHFWWQLSDGVDLDHAVLLVQRHQALGEVTLNAGFRSSGSGLLALAARLLKSPPNHSSPPPRLRSQAFLLSALVPPSTGIWLRLLPEWRITDRREGPKHSGARAVVGHRCRRHQR
jgi:hypothetical protein